MGIVRFALRFPHTFYVLAALILFLGVTAIRAMPTDTFPQINIPVVTVIWSYTGLSTPEMEQRVSTYSQYSISSNVNGIKNMEAQTMDGISVQRIFFQPDVNLDLAISQIVSATNAIRALMPPGIQPPIIVQFNASSVPVLQISLTSNTLNEQQLYDFGIYRLRQQLAPVPGVTFPTPAGGKYRQIMVDLDPAKLLAKGLTPLDVVNAVNVQNLTLPAGTAKIGDKEYTVRTNSIPATIGELNTIPIKYQNGATVLVKDVGQVRDAFAVQQNIVRQNGLRAVLLTVIKNGNASTLDVVNGVKAALAVARAAAPPGLNINELFDQSVFVKASVDGVVREGAIAAALTALMILLFLGSWRSTLIVLISIPLAILVVARGALFPRTHAQHHDARRPCARHRHPGRRFHGHHREHPSAAQRGEDAARAGDALRLGRHRRANAGLDARHLLRVHLGRVPRGTGQISVHAARPRRGVRHARVVCAVADADADHHRPSAQGRAARRSPRRHAAELVRALSCRLRARLRDHAPELCRSLEASPHPESHRPHRRHRRAFAGWRDVFRSRPRFLSAHRWRTDPAACPRSVRNTHRDDREVLCGDRGQDPRGDPREGPPADRRQYRSARPRLQSGVHRRLDHRRQ